MTTTAKEILELANVEKCLEDTGADSTYGHCHNACVWLIMQIKKAGISDFNIFLCAGTFWGKDHSWLLVQEENPKDINEHTDIVIDMTVNQFVDREVPFSAVMTDEYEINDSVLICMDEELINFVQRLG